MRLVTSLSFFCADSSGRAKAARSSTTAAASVATVNDVGDFSLQKTISNIEQRLDSARLHDDTDDDADDDDVMPAIANEMGAGELPCWLTPVVEVK